MNYKLLVATVGIILILAELLKLGSGNYFGEYAGYVALPVIAGAAIILLQYLNKRKK